jgi:hypothetical protein
VSKIIAPRASTILKPLTSPAPHRADLPQGQYTPFDRERQIDLLDQQFSGWNEPERIGAICRCRFDGVGGMEKNDASQSMVNEFETIPALECLQRNWLRFLP